MFNALKSAAAALLAICSTSALAADALSAFTNSGATTPFGYGGYNAGPAAFSPASDCFGVAGFDCRQHTNTNGDPASVGKSATAADLGAATLDPAYLNVLPFSFSGPSVAIFYNHDGSAPVRLRASFKLLADADPENLRVAIFRETFNFMFPSPSNLASVEASVSNLSGSFEAIVTDAGKYGVHVTHSTFETFPRPGFGQRRDWIGLNLEVLPAATPVPEPATWAMLLIGFGVAGTALRQTGKAQREAAAR